ncbi:hypothetical protein ACJX0J_034365, partial [Zea mays]
STCTIWKEPHKEERMEEQQYIEEHRIIYKDPHSTLNERTLVYNLHTSTMTHALVNSFTIFVSAFRKCSDDTTNLLGNFLFNAHKAPIKSLVKDSSCCIVSDLPDGRSTSLLSKQYYYFLIYSTNNRMKKKNKNYIVFSISLNQFGVLDLILLEQVKKSYNSSGFHSHNPLFQHIERKKPKELT